MPSKLNIKLKRAIAKKAYPFPNYDTYGTWNVYTENWLGIPWGLTTTKRDAINKAYHCTLRKKDSSFAYQMADVITTTN